MSALHALVGFMAGLNNADADGRIILDPAVGTLKFLLLNAAAHFSKVRLCWQISCTVGSEQPVSQACHAAVAYLRQNRFPEFVFSWRRQPSRMSHILLQSSTTAKQDCCMRVGGWPSPSCFS